MGQFQDKQIKDVVNGLNENYFLPDIQREYVWLSKPGEKKIEELFDSILRGYPIGSFLFWKVKKNDIETDKDAEDDSGKLNFQLYKFIEKYNQRKGNHNEKINVEQINFDELSIVLDGQQRLTSLYIGLKGSRTLKKKGSRWDNPNAYEEKKLFLNLRYSPNEEMPDDNYQFEFHAEGEVPPPDENNYWFKVGEILKLDGIVDYVLENNLSRAEAKILEKLRNAFCSDNLISYFEEDQKDLGRVLKIFIRVNSAGTVLSHSDLLMSILTANFSTDIRDVMNDFVDSIAEKDFDVFKRDHMLKTCLLVTESRHAFQLRNFRKGNINKIEKHWDEICTAINKAITLLRDFGYAGKLSSGYILSVIAYYLFKTDNVTDDDKREMLNFVRIAQIKSYFTTAVDTKLDNVVRAFKKSKNFVEIRENLSKELPLQVSENDVEDMLSLKYRKDYSTFPVLQLLYPNLDYKQSKFHIDHIYPQSKFTVSNKCLPEEYRNRSKGDLIYNLQILEGSENLSKQDQDPKEWLEREYASDQDRIREYKERNYISVDFSLDWKDIAEFEEARNNKLREELKRIFKIGA